MAFGYPVSLEISGRRIVVIGARAVAEGKVGGLLAAGADHVVVIARGPGGRLDLLAAHPRVRVERRDWGPDDLDGAFLVVAERRGPEANEALYREARARGALVNVIDDTSHCDFAAPALVRRGDLVIAVSTGGRSPALARRLREQLSERYGPQWGDLLDVLGQVRDETLPLLPDVAERSGRWRRALDLEEAEALVAEGRHQELRARLVRRLVGTASLATADARACGGEAPR